MPTAQKYRVLVADDEESYRDLLKMQLISAGYEVSLATDGNEAIDKLRQTRFDVVLLDIRMPKVDGIEVLKYISKNVPSTKTIMLTGFADLALAMQAKEYGAVDFINKPFSLDDLLTTVRLAIVPKG